MLALTPISSIYDMCVSETQFIFVFPSMLSSVTFCAVYEAVFAVHHLLSSVRLPLMLIHSHYHDCMAPEVLSCIPDALPTLFNWQCSSLHTLGTQMTHSSIQLASRHFPSISY